MNKTMVYVCADDYGMSKMACRRIEDCAKNGALNKISIFPNSDFCKFSNYLLNKDITLSLHINLVEGKALANVEDLSLLVSKDGYFKCSFIRLLILSMFGKRKDFERQVYTEIKAQLTRFRECVTSDMPIAIDSHQHTHMIPLIFKILMQVIRDEGIDIKYIRIPSEPILPYIKTPSLYFTYNPVNIVKQWLLKLFGLINKKELKKSQIKTAYFMGILFSGKMDEKRVNKILPHYYKLADKNNMDIELLFHPGYMEYDDSVFDIRKKGFEKFYFSKGRKIEFDTVMNLSVNIADKKEECSNAVY